MYIYCIILLIDYIYSIKYESKYTGWDINIRLEYCHYLWKNIVYKTCTVWRRAYYDINI